MKTNLPVSSKHFTSREPPPPPHIALPHTCIALCQVKKPTIISFSQNPSCFWQLNLALRPWLENRVSDSPRSHAKSYTVCNKTHKIFIIINEWCSRTSSYISKHFYLNDQSNCEIFYFSYKIKSKLWNLFPLTQPRDQYKVAFTLTIFLTWGNCDDIFLIAFEWKKYINIFTPSLIQTYRSKKFALSHFNCPSKHKIWNCFKIVFFSPQFLFQNVKLF